MRRTATLSATAAVIALVSGLASPLAVAGDKPMLPMEVFRQIVQNWVDAENRGDAAAMAALFTNNAILLPPGGGEPIWGEDNVRRFLDEYAKHKMDNHKVTPTVLLKGGPDSMIEAGVWSGDVPARDGTQPTHVTGTYLAVGILVDGEWKLWATSWQGKSGVFDSSTPPQVGTSTPNK